MGCKRSLLMAYCTFRESDIPSKSRKQATLKVLINGKNYIFTKYSYLY